MHLVVCLGLTHAVPPEIPQTAAVSASQDIDISISTAAGVFVAVTWWPAALGEPGPQARTILAHSWHRSLCGTRGGVEVFRKATMCCRNNKKRWHFIDLGCFFISIMQSCREIVTGIFYSDVKNSIHVPSNISCLMDRLKYPAKWFLLKFIISLINFMALHASQLITKNNEARHKQRLIRSKWHQRIWEAEVVWVLQWKQ